MAFRATLSSTKSSYTWLYAQEWPQLCLGDHMQCQEWNWSKLHARQVPYLLYYLSHSVLWNLNIAIINEFWFVFKIFTYAWFLWTKSYTIAQLSNQYEKQLVTFYHYCTDSHWCGIPENPINRYTINLVFPRKIELQFPYLVCYFVVYLKE